MAKQQPPEILQWIADSLNEYAALIDAGQDAPQHTPTSPMFWFAGLAGETRNTWKSPAMADLLKEPAKRYLHALNIPVAE